MYKPYYTYIYILSRNCTWLYMYSHSQSTLHRSGSGRSEGSASKQHRYGKQGSATSNLHGGFNCRKNGQKMGLKMWYMWYPSGNDIHSLRTWSHGPVEIVDLPIILTLMCDFPVRYVNLPEGIFYDNQMPQLPWSPSPSLRPVLLWSMGGLKILASLTPAH